MESKYSSPLGNKLGGIMPNCFECGDTIPESEFYSVDGENYCQCCYDELYTYCTNCEDSISRSDARYNSQGEPYCESCYDKLFDDEAPNNPEVDKNDRELIIELSRNFLQDKIERRTSIKVNSKDNYLLEIRKKVGLIENTLYVFGLKDRQEYQITASANIIEEVNEYLLVNAIEATVIEDIGDNRFGISLSLRKNNLPHLVKLIKSITKEKVLQTA